MTTSGVALGRAEATELERRVLAHERILQALIAYMSSTEPRFVSHLRDQFVEPMKMARREHDYRDVDDYAEEFIRAIMLIGEKSTPAIPDEPAGGAPAETPIARAKPSNSLLLPDRIQIKEAGGIWHMTVDGEFAGDYCKEEEALSAMALAKLSLR